MATTHGDKQTGAELLTSHFGAVSLMLEVICRRASWIRIHLLGSRPSSAAAACWAARSVHHVHSEIAMVRTKVRRDFDVLLAGAISLRLAHVVFRPAEWRAAPGTVFRV